MATPQHAIPTAPRRIPLLGHLPSLLRQPMAFLEEMRNYGDVVKIYLGTHPSYLINSPELIRRILVTDANKFDRGRLFQKVRSVVGNGLVVTEGAFHRRQRRIMQPAFHGNRIGGYVDVMREHTAKLANAWEPGRQLAFDEEMVELTLTVSAKALFSADVASPMVSEVQRQLPIMLGGVLMHTVMPDFWAKIPTPSHRRYRTAQKRLRSVVDAIIDCYRTQGVDHGDLLSMLLSARDEETGEPMGAEQLRDEAITILMAATETTAALLSWLFHALGQNAAIEQRLYAEIRDVLGGRPVTFEDLDRLVYTRRVLKETLRRHNPVWFILRHAIVSVDFDGAQIPADAQVFYSPTSLHRDPRLYSNPLQFDPDRWLPERAKTLSRAAFSPFGAGSHQCIGENFAWVEMMIAVATILARWRLVPARDYRVKEAVFTILRPNGLPMTVHPR